MTSPSPPYHAIAVGASSGGFRALKEILPALPADFGACVLVVFHRHPDSDNYLETALDQECALRVKQADHKEKLVGRTVYIAPPNYHMMIEDDQTIAFTVDDAVNYARPSIDVLFESAAHVFGSTLVGVVLTGANADGSKGLKAIKENGGLTVVQSPETAQMDAMPKAAIGVGAPDHILPLNRIGDFLAKLNRREAAPEDKQCPSGAAKEPV